jgi:hypothetical protein
LETALVLGLNLVVELVGDPVADLAQDGGRVEVRCEALDVSNVVRLGWRWTTPRSTPPKRG